MSRIILLFSYLVVFFLHEITLKKIQTNVPLLHVSYADLKLSILCILINQIKNKTCISTDSLHLKSF